MDRAHRLGQTRQVTVYRLITKNTIEERILQRAKQKDEIQKVVISGGEFKQQVDFKPREIVSLLLDDEELENKLLDQQLKRKAEEEAKLAKSLAKPIKRQKVAPSASTSNPGTAATSIAPRTLDELFSAGGDVLPEDSIDGAEPSGTSAKKRRSSKSKGGKAKVTKKTKDEPSMEDAAEIDVV